MSKWGARNALDCAGKAVFATWTKAEKAAHRSQQMAGDHGLVFRPYVGKCCGGYHVGGSVVHANDNTRHSGTRRPQDEEIDVCDLKRIQRLCDALDLEST